MKSIIQIESLAYNNRGFKEGFVVYILVKSPVADFDRWKEGFDAHASVRENSGQVGDPQVFQSDDDPTSTVVLLQWENRESAEKFANSDDLKKAMMESGVTGAPEMMYLNAK